MYINLPTEIKRVFLSFIQQYYATEAGSKLAWNVDRRLTKIFIGDKSIVAPEVVEKTPSIILVRGAMTYAQTSIDQRLQTDLPSALMGMDPNKTRTDLIQGTIVFQCLSPNGIEAETIANTLFINLIGYKDQLRRNGIHQILGVSMGEETPVRSDVVPRLVAVPVIVRFTAQVTMATTLDLFTIKVLVDDRFTPYAEDGPYGRVYSDWFAYQISGSQLIFNRPPASGANISVDYTGRYTLTSYTTATPAGIVDGVNRIFTLPEDVYTMYYVVSGFVLDPYTVDTTGMDYTY